MKNRDDKKWKHDPDYIRYIASGESATVFVVRDVVKAVKTSGKWISIISMNCYEQDDDGKAFHWIVCEIFQRKIQPVYIGQDTDYNKYITWKTAHDDIADQRSKGVKGPKFLVLCTLRNKNKGRYVKLRLVSVVERYLDSFEELWEFEETLDEQETIKAPLKPDPKYIINFLSRLSNAQAEYIKSHEEEILRRILENGRVTPEIMGIKKESKKNNE